MPRYSLSQLLAGITLFALIAAFASARGCAERYSMIESVAFSADDTSILVAKLTARDAQVPGKGYKTDLYRTVSWLEASTGRFRNQVHQNSARGKRGTGLAFWYWRVGRTSVVGNPDSDQVTMSKFRGGGVIWDARSKRPAVTSLWDQPLDLAYSSSGRYLAARNDEGLAVLDAQNHAVTMEIRERSGFLDAPCMAFLEDDRHLVVASRASIEVWDIQQSKRVSTFDLGSGTRVCDIATAPNDHVFVCTADGVVRYDLGGQVIAKLGREFAQTFAVSADGSTCCVASDETAFIFDLETNGKVMSITIEDARPYCGVTALALSSDGGQLAVGDCQGRVTLINAKTGVRRWRVYPPRASGWPRRTSGWQWTLTAAFLGGGVYLACRLTKKEMPSECVDVN